MNRIKYVDRINEIENSWNAPIEGLLYQMHWGENMMHREIGKTLGLPRPTISRWFAQLRIPTQSCRRFTDKNLTSWLYKTGKLEKKPRYEGPDRRIQRTKGGLNVDFLKTWSSEMAYALGYFAADGCMYKNSGQSKYFNFVSTDYELLKKVKKILQSNHRIVLKRKTNDKWKNAYWLQIGSKEMYNDLLKFGFRPKKNMRLKFPYIPDRYLRHFVRGYFDGDGHVVYGWYNRKARGNKKYFCFHTGFTSSSRRFLNDLSNRLSARFGMGSGSLFPKPRSWGLSYSKKDTLKLFIYMYTGVASDRYLWRKYSRFLEIFRNSKKGT